MIRTIRFLLDMSTLVYPLGIIGWQEILIILAVVLLLFGGRKIPELMEGLGKGVKSFKKGMKDVETEAKETKNEIEKED